MGQALVGQADDNLIYSGLILEAIHGRGDSNVRFELDHRPDHQAQDADSFFGDGEPGQEIQINAFAGPE